MNEHKTSGNGIGLKFLLASAAIVILFAALKAAQSLIAPFFLAVFFALVLLPPLRWLKQKGLSDSVALIALSGIVFIAGVGIVAVASSSLTSFGKRLPEYQKKINIGLDRADDFLNEIMTKFGSVEEEIKKSVPRFTFSDDVADNVDEESQPVATYSTPTIGPLPERSEAEQAALNEAVASDRFTLRNAVQLDSLVTYIQVGIREILNIVTVSFLVVVMVVFMLIEASRMPAKIREAFGGRDLTNEYFRKIADDTWNYMKIKTAVGLATGLATAIGLWFLGVEYAILWGLLAFFLNYIPNIGQFISSIPPILLALLDQGVTSAALVTAWLVFVNTAFGYGVEPRYLGEGLGISSLVVLLSLIFWGWLLGPIGMFLSAPLTMVLKIVLQNDENTRWIATLLSNRAG